MYTQNNLFFIITCIILLCSSCSPFYVSQAPLTPLFTASKQAEINMNTGLNGFNLSAAYAFDSNTMFTINGRNNILTDPSDGINRSIQGGIGHFKTLNKSKSNVCSVFEMEGGVGLGRADVHADRFLTYNDEKGNFYKIYGKLAIGSVGDYHKVSVQSYFSYINPYNLTINNNSIGIKKQYLFFEPSISLGLGIKYVKLNSMLGICLPIYYNYSLVNNSSQLMSFNVITFNIGIGVSIPSIK